MGIRLNVTAFLIGSAIAVFVLGVRKVEAIVVPVEEPPVVEPPVFEEPIIQPPIEQVPEAVPGEINVTVPDPLEVALVAVGV